MQVCVQQNTVDFGKTKNNACNVLKREDIRKKQGFVVNMVFISHFIRPRHRKSWKQNKVSKIKK